MSNTNQTWKRQTHIFCTKRLACLLLLLPFLCPAQIGPGGDLPWYRRNDLEDRTLAGVPLVRFSMDADTAGGSRLLNAAAGGQNFGASQDYGTNYFTTLTNGVWRQGLFYNGSTSYSELADPGISTNELTVLAWVKIPTTNFYATIISKSQVPSAWSWLIEQASGTWTGATGKEFGVAISSTADLTTYQLAYATNTVITDDSWHQIGFTWTTNGLLSLYIDGRICAKHYQHNDSFTSISPGTTPITVGAEYNAGSPNAFLKGTIDEVLVFNNALSSNAVSLDY